MDQPLISELKMHGRTSHGASKNLRRALFQRAAYMPPLIMSRGPLGVAHFLAISRPVEFIVLADISNTQTAYT